jgi:hypothetical protein
MTTDEVESLVASQIATGLSVPNDRRIALEQVIVPPQKLTVIWQKAESGHLKDMELNVWLVGQESNAGGYSIIMREDGKQFGLASPGFPTDRHPVLVGWYGNLSSASLAM